MKNYISISKAADILNISIPGVFSANKRGTLPLYEVDRGINLVKLTDVIVYKKNRKKANFKGKVFPSLPVNEALKTTNAGPAVEKTAHTKKVVKKA